jgi:hypothetical protein
LFTAWMESMVHLSCYNSISLFWTHFWLKSIKEKLLISSEVWIEISNLTHFSLFPKLFFLFLASSGSKVLAKLGVKNSLLSNSKKVKNSLLRCSLINWPVQFYSSRSYGIHSTAAATTYVALR